LPAIKRWSRQARAGEEMTNDMIDTRVRDALDAKAHDLEVPDGLAERTLAIAREQAPQPLWRRTRAWRDGRSMRKRPSTRPRALAAAGAVACAVLFFVIGTVVTRPSDVPTTRAVERTSGDESKRATRTASRPAARAKDSRDTKTSAGFVGLTGGSATRVQVEKNESSTQGGDAVAGQVAGTVSSGDASVDATRRSASTEADAESADGDFSDQAIDVETGDAAGGARGSRGVPVNEIAPPAAVRGPFLDPKLVKSADIRVAVEDFDPAWNAANDVAAKFGGAVINSRTRQVGARIAQGTVTMRVPSVRLDDVLEELRGLGTLAQLITSGDDIAEQIDQNKRKIEDVRAEEADLVEMQRRAATVSEQLQVKRRLEDVRRSIDSLKKKQKNYEDQVEFSAVTATIFEDESVADDGSVLERAFDTGTSAALTILAGTLVIVAALLPIAVLATTVWFGVRTLRRRRPGAEG
jgi:hypothetical protein